MGLLKIHHIKHWATCLSLHILSGMALPCFAQTAVDDFRALTLGQIQIIGSHNSYKPGMDSVLFSILLQRDSARAATLQYGHIGLIEQLNLGLRNLELDVVHDPLGGRYSKPAGLQLLEQIGAVAQPYDTAGDLLKPGLKVMHIPDIDFRSDYLLFTECLYALKQWSKSNKMHIPIIITINAKDGAEKGLEPLLPFGVAALDSIDAAIRQVFNEDELITPDFIRGTSSSLAEVILQKGWPSIEKLAGRFLFVLDETGRKLNDYKSGHQGLQGRVMFVNEPDGNPDAAVMIINEPERDKALIKQMVEKGYLVRTRADANTVEARTQNYERFKAAMESGAQIITTDYYIPSKLFPSFYEVRFSGGSFVRKNPVTHNTK